MRMSIAVFVLVICLMSLAMAFAMYVLWTKMFKEIKYMRDSVHDECDCLWKRIRELDTARSSEIKTSQEDETSGKFASISGDLDNIYAQLNENYHDIRDCEASINNLKGRLGELKLGERVLQAEDSLKAMNVRTEHLETRIRDIHDRLVNIELSNHYQA